MPGSRFIVVALIALTVGSPAWADEFIELYEQRHRDAWARNGTPRKDFELIYTPRLRITEGATFVEVPGTIHKHLDVFWSVTGEMTFAGLPENFVTRVEVEYADGRRQALTAPPWRFAARPVRKVRLDSTLMERSWSLEWVVPDGRACPQALLRAVARDLADPQVGGQCRGAPVSRVIGVQGPEHAHLERWLRQHPEHLGYAPAHAPVGASCKRHLHGAEVLPEGVDEDELLTATAAEYHWMKKRLTDGVRGTLERIAAIDQQLAMGCGAGGRLGMASPAGLARGLDCGRFSASPGAQESCRHYQQRCRAPVDYTPMLQSTEVALRLAEQLQTRRDALAADHADRAALDSLLRAVEATSPWMTGEHFRRRYQKQLGRCLESGAGEEACDRRRTEFICRGIHSEARQLRPVLVEQAQRFARAARCLEGLEECEARELRETVAQAPRARPLSIPDFPEGYTPTEEERREAQDTILARNAFSRAECRHLQRDARDRISDAYWEFGVGVGLTVATCGLGEAVALARAAVAAGNASRTTLSVARGLELAVLGLDLADLSRGVAEGVRSCSDAFARAVPGGGPSLAAPACPGADSGPNGARLVQDYRDCVLRAAGTEVLTGLLPGAPAAVRAALDSQTLRGAQRALEAGRALEGARREAILAAFRRRLSATQGAATAEAVEALRRAGFSEGEVVRLFEELAGFRPHAFASTDLPTPGAPPPRVGTRWDDFARHRGARFFDEAGREYQRNREHVKELAATLVGEDGWITLYRREYPEAIPLIRSRGRVVPGEPTPSTAEGIMEALRDHITMHQGGPSEFTSFSHTAPDLTLKGETIQVRIRRELFERRCLLGQMDEREVLVIGSFPTREVPGSPGVFEVIE